MTDSNEHDVDARLGALLAMDEPAPDPHFAARMLALIDADRRLAAARRAAWKRFAMEAAAAAAIGGAVLAMLHLGMDDMDLAVGPSLAAACSLFAFVGLGHAAASRF